MEVLNETTFDNLSTALLMAEEGYLEAFLKNCGNLDVNDEDDYGTSWCAATCVFPDLRQYYNEDNALPVFKDPSRLHTLAGYLLRLPNNDDLYSDKNNRLYAGYRDLLER